MNLKPFEPLDDEMRAELTRSLKRVYKVYYGSEKPPRKATPEEIEIIAKAFEIEPHELQILMQELDGR